mgnify:FL=1
MNQTERLSEHDNSVITALVVPSDRLTITVEEFAVLAGIGRTTAYEAARRGEIPARRIGRRYILPVPLVRQWFGEIDSSAESAPHLGRHDQGEAVAAEPDRSG